MTILNILTHTKMKNKECKSDSKWTCWSF